MKLTTKELIEMLVALDTLINPDFEGDETEKRKEKLCIKLSKEIHKRGFRNMIADSWIKHQNSTIA